MYMNKITSNLHVTNIPQYFHTIPVVRHWFQGSLNMKILKLWDKRTSIIDHEPLFDTEIAQSKTQQIAQTSRYIHPSDLITFLSFPFPSIIFFYLQIYFRPQNPMRASTTKKTNKTSRQKSPISSSDLKQVRADTNKTCPLPIWWSQSRHSTCPYIPILLPSLASNLSPAISPILPLVRKPSKAISHSPLAE